MTPISSTQFTATGSLTNAADNHSATCGGAGRDLAFSFVVVSPSDVSFSITSIGGSAQPIGFLLRDDCTSELRCHSGTAASAGVVLQPGSYRLIVDAFTSTVTGSFTATVTLSTPAPMVGDNCGSAEVLTLTGGSASTSGTTDGFMDDVVSSSCNSVGPDRFYRVTLATTASLSATVTPASNSFAGLALLGPTTITSCASASESTCSAGTSNGSATSISAPSLSAGTYYLVVKNLGSGTGAFSLSVTSTAAGVPGDTCTTAVPLSFVAGSASATGTIVGATNDRSATCATSAADVVYSFTATAGQVLTATATPGSWRPMLTLSSGSSCSSATELACNAATSIGGSATVTSAPLTAGTHYLWVDSVSGSGSGTFSLSATLSAGSAGGTCAAPIPLAFVSGSASATGTTTGLVNNNSSNCTGSSGPDSVYSFTATAGQAFTATLTPASTYRGHLILKGPNADCASATEVGCQLGASSGSVVSLSAPSLTGGSYYLIVDGVSGSSGTFSLSATLSGGSTATGENCSSPIPLNFVGATATASGTTATAVSDRASACGGSGPDRVYSFTVSGTRTFSATVTPSSTHRPVIYVTGPGSCSTTVTELACVAATSTGLSAALSSQTLTSGTYFLWVDSWSGTSGTYTLTATLQ